MAVEFTWREDGSVHSTSCRENLNLGVRRPIVGLETLKLPLPSGWEGEVLGIHRLTEVVASRRALAEGPNATVPVREPSDDTAIGVLEDWSLLVHFQILIFTIADLHVA